MRKRNRQKIMEQHKPTNNLPSVPKRKINKSQLFIVISLISIFFLVLFFNSYFNYTAGTAFNPEGTTLGTHFFLSGPDPYYNMRLCEITLKTGHYPFLALSDGDPLLNYPVGVLAGARPPLFNLIAVGGAKLFSIAMSELDALGWMMLILPALYGALTVFPVYGIGKELFNKKVGIIAALLMPLIPLFVGSGHGSSFSLFDTDSFITLMTTVMFYCIIKAYKQTSTLHTYVFALLGGISLSAVYLTWDGAYSTLVLLALITIIQLFIAVLKHNTPNIKFVSITTIVLGVNFFISLPYNIYVSYVFGYSFFTFLLCLIITIVYYIIKKVNLPWILSIPSFGALAGGVVFVLYLVNQGIIYLGASMQSFSNLLFVLDIYRIYGQKITGTIAEAQTFSLSQIAMAIGPVIYWLGLLGFCFFLYKTHRSKWQAHDTFFVIVFFINFWLTTNSGRFMINIVTQICIFTAFVLLILLEKIDYKTMIHNIKSIGGLHGIRKGVRVIHVLGILFIVFVVIFPNTYLALDSAVPGEMKEEVFGKGFQGISGNSLSEQIYWSDALNWLSQQDTNITLPQNRPGILTWWDYGFYSAALSEHPTVSDNFQEGFIPAANFLTSQTEQEAISVLIIRLAEGTQKLSPITKEAAPLSSAVEQVFRDYFPPYIETKTENNQTFNITHTPAEDIIMWMNNRTSSPTYNQPIAPEWGNTVMLTNADNAMYHSITNIFITLDDEKLLSLYDDVSTATGYDIRYFGIEQRDITSIFAVFPLLSDKSVYSVTGEDDWFQVLYVDQKTGMQYTRTQVVNMPEENISKMNLVTSYNNKETFFNSTAYKLFYGFQNQQENQRSPCFRLRHFYSKYNSPVITIAKFYEGANITGTVKVNGEPYMFGGVIVIDEFGVPHDAVYIQQDGSFKVIVPPGSVILAIVRDNNLVASYRLPMNITEEQAMRKVTTDINIPIDVLPASVNITISNITIPGLTLKIIDNFFGTEKTITNLENTIYHIDGLMPNTYTFSVENTNTTKQQFLNPNDNNVNIVIGET